jgi:predicted AlkP superfamily pyrophosphatase or phosphodiesterase
MRKIATLLILTLSLNAHAQSISRPKLVVGLVVDQMRYDYLYRFYDRYSPGGFKRLLLQGFSCENTFIPYLPTHTAAGHTSIYTGSVPALNGIMGNSWYDKAQKKVVYCTDDTSVISIGSNSTAVQMSPANLWANTITDQLRLATNFTSKTIAIALKDRASILPGGHMSNASYWFDNATGGWITSSYYMKDLPAWVKAFNAKKIPDNYLRQNWNTLYPITSYVQSTADSNEYENKLGAEDYTFPHNTSNISSNRYEAFRTTPFGNSYTLEMAREAIRAEQLGKRGVTDFLALSLSSTDYIGHTFGPNSVEVEDTYLRLDKDLTAFFQYLDATIGKGQYLLFLTADHGAAHNPNFLKDNRIKPKSLDEAALRIPLNDSLQNRFKVKNLIARYINYQYFLNDSVLTKNNLEKEEVKQYIIKLLVKQPSVAFAVDMTGINESSLPANLKMVLNNSYNPQLSGDIQVIFKPAGIDSWRTGITHGLWNPYDSHIPLVWFGWNIKHGATNREIYMTDIAVTLAALLHIQMPDAAIGKVITEVVK